LKLNITVLITFVILTACSASNKISTSWKSPEVTDESTKFQTVAVFTMVKNSDMRMDVEEAIASQMLNTIAVPSYKMITNEELAVSVKSQLIEDGLLDPTK
jgi:hypothetical protein